MGMNVMFLFSEKSILFQQLVTFDWVTSGYILYILGSSIYFVQALNPFLPDNDIEEEESVYYSYYEDGPFTDNDISKWMSVVAAIIFVVESSMYIVGWYIGRTFGDQSIVLHPWYLDMNHWGNLLFFIGSLGYLYTSYTYFHENLAQTTHFVNICMGVLFIVDSILYMLAIIWPENSLLRFTVPPTWTFRSSIDLYFIASLLFVLGSIIYLLAAVMASRLGDKEIVAYLNLCGAIVFMVDSPLYYISAFQERSDEVELDFLKRKNYFFIDDIEQMHAYVSSSSEPQACIENFMLLKGEGSTSDLNIDRVSRRKSEKLKSNVDNRGKNNSGFNGYNQLQQVDTESELFHMRESKDGYL